MRSLHVFVHLYPIAQKFNIQFIQTHLIYIGLPADTHQYLIHRYNRRLALFLNGNTGTADFRYLRTQIKLDSSFLIFSPQHGTGFFIHRSQYLGHHFNDTDLHPHTIIKRSEFHPYHSATNNGKRLRQRSALQSLFGSPIVKF